MNTLFPSFYNSNLMKVHIWFLLGGGHLLFIRLLRCNYTKFRFFIVSRCFSCKYLTLFIIHNLSFSANFFLCAFRNAIKTKDIAWGTFINLWIIKGYNLKLLYKGYTIKIHFNYNLIGNCELSTANLFKNKVVKYLV